jgi:hypothetical protein
LVSAQAANFQRIIQAEKRMRAASLTPTPTQTPTPTPTFTPTPGWDPGRTFNQASGVLVDMGQTAADTLIWLFVVGGPPTAIGLVSLGAIRWIRRKRA